MIERCPACDAMNYSIDETWKGYRLATCAECGLTFTLNPDYKPERYVAAYRNAEGESPVPDGYGFVYSAPAKRLEIETRAFFIPPPRLTPAQKVALHWLERHAPKDSLVIDCGCGTGLFLRGLKRKGIRGVGVELSPTLVDFLVGSGLRAILGKAPDFPWEGNPPFAIVFFDVLEHFHDPSMIIGTLKRRFPETRIIASVPSPTRAGLLIRGERGQSDLPPNHFMRWTVKALKAFFLREGYTRIIIRVPPPVGSELLPGLGFILARSGRLKLSSKPSGDSPRRAHYSPLKRIYATAQVWLQKAYQVTMDLVGSPSARRARRKGASASSMLVIAERRSQ
jgi:SAM-dependent methyltransferase